MPELRRQSRQRRIGQGHGNRIGGQRDPGEEVGGKPGRHIASAASPGSSARKPGAPAPCAEPDDRSDARGASCWVIAALSGRTGANAMSKANHDGLLTSIARRLNFGTLLPSMRIGEARLIAARRQRFARDVVLPTGSRHVAPYLRLPAGRCLRWGPRPGSAAGGPGVGRPGATQITRPLPVIRQAAARRCRAGRCAAPHPPVEQFSATLPRWVKRRCLPRPIHHAPAGGICLPRHVHRSCVSMLIDCAPRYRTPPRVRRRCRASIKAGGAQCLPPMIASTS